MVALFKPTRYIFSRWDGGGAGPGTPPQRPVPPCRGPKFTWHTKNILKKKIKWPTAKDKKAWHDFDKDIIEILEITSKGSVDKRLITIAKIIAIYAAKRYGYEKGKRNVPARKTKER